jgi:DNA-binding NarL/FixJ family response regulator
MPVRVVLVEDNEVFREALELMLGARDDVEVVAAVPRAAAVDAVREQSPDVVLDGVGAKDELIAEHPRLAVVALDKDQELDAIVAAIEQAADAA